MYIARCDNTIKIDLHKLIGGNPYTASQHEKVCADVICNKLDLLLNV